MSVLSSSDIQAIPEGEDPYSYPPLESPSSGGTWADAVAAVVEFTGVTGLALLLFGITVWLSLKAYQKIRTTEITTDGGSADSINGRLMELLSKQVEEQSAQVGQLREYLELERNTVAGLQRENDKLRAQLMDKEDH